MAAWASRYNKHVQATINMTKVACTVNGE